MQQRSLFRQQEIHAETKLTATPMDQTNRGNQLAPSLPKPSASPGEAARMFNTVLVSSRVRTKKDFSRELFELTESSAFKAILSAVKQLSQLQGISERQASEQVIQTFRKMDEVWGEYLFHEGVDRLRGQRNSG